MRPFLVILMFIVLVTVIYALVYFAYKATVGKVRALRHQNNHLKAVLNDVERALVMAGPDPYVQRALNFIYLNDDTDKELSA